MDRLPPCEMQLGLVSKINLQLVGGLEFVVTVSRENATLSSERNQP